jgi:azurin
MEAFCQSKPLTEDDFYELVTIPAPEGVMLEVGGIATLPDGRVAVSTRRGEIWLIENAYMHNQTKPYFKQFASGLHEILGLAYKDGAFYCTQRGELTKITDIDGDEVADLYEPIAKFQLSGNYHEYSYGPVLDKQGNMLVTLNLAWVGYGEGKFAKWRGWLLKISPDGKVEPLATGLRSPAGFNINELGDIFYGENQGDWVGSGRVTHLEKGDFAGNPGGLTWTKEPDSPLKLSIEDIPDTGEPLYKATEKVKSLKLPAVWFPHTLMGISTADILEDNTHGKFGPFEGQYFVADQGHSKVMRMFLEKVKGQYQGVCFPFREGWMSGLLRLRWGIDGSLFGGMTSRGWASTGKAPFGLQRLVWTGKVPFEMKAIRAMPDGFEIEFTKPVAKQTAERLSNYDISSFNYKYHHQYGSPVIDNQPCSIQKIVVSDDLLKVRLVVRGIRQYYVHQIKLLGVKAENEEGLLHSVGYYTLNQIPEGDKIDVGIINTMPAHSHHVEKPTVSVKNKPLASLKRANTQPIDWINGADQVITLGTKPGLMFDTDKIEVKAGSKIKWVFNNNDDMTHNCVIVKPNTANDVGILALDLGLKGETVSYVPKSVNVLFHTGLLQPNSSETIYFVAPAEEGEYQFVCTYPGHFNVMQGVLRVSK